MCIPDGSEGSQTFVSTPLCNATEIKMSSLLSDKEKKLSVWVKFWDVTGNPYSFFVHKNVKSSFAGRNDKH